MPSLTLAVTQDLKEEMDALPEINWSEIARKAISEKVSEYKLFKSIVSKSKLSQKDALEIAGKVNEGLYKAYKKRLEEMK